MVFKIDLETFYDPENKDLKYTARLQQKID